LGQKVNPIGFRLGIIKTWESRWFGGKNYAHYIFEDHKLRQFVKQKLYHAGVSRIEIERSAKRIRLRIFTARPGIVIGKKGAEIALLKKEIEKLTAHEVLIDIQEIRKPEIDAQLVAENVATQLERRVAFRRAMKRAVQSALRFGALGIKVICAGRWAVRKSPGPSGIGKGASPCTRYGRTLITVWPRRGPLTELWRESQYLQGEVLRKDQPAAEQG